MTNFGRDLTRVLLAFVLGVFMLGLVFGLCIGYASAQDGHGNYHDHYMDWKRPHQPGTPCCSARVERDGSMTGDCAPTEAEARPSAKPELNGALVWWARRHDDRRWIEIPEDRIVRYVNPDPTGRDAHLCETHYGRDDHEVQLVHCFRPPVGGV